MGKATQMTPDRLVALDSLGFTWSKCEKRDWEGRLEDLRQYKEKVGDCLVPQRYADNVQLGTWVNNQRTMYKLHIAGETTSLTKERIQALEAVGFKWYVASGRGSSCKEMKKSRGEVL